MSDRLDGINIIMGLAACAALFYLLLASSEEFGGFAPYPVSDTVFYICTAAGGGIVGFTTRGKETSSRLILVGIVLFLPVVSYVGLVVWSWLHIAGSEFLNIFVLQALQKIIMHGTLVGMFGISGAGLGVFLESKLS